MNNYHFRIDKPKIELSYRDIPFYNQVFLLGKDDGNQPPPILYKYMRIGTDEKINYSERLLDTLLEGAFWFSTKRYLNDPCEMSYVKIAAESFPPPNPAVSFSFEPLSKEVAENFNLCRITCFSESWKEGPMWANYSNGQKGVCVGFETKNLVDCFFPVIYNDNVDKDLLVGRDGLVNAFSLKSESWSYEKEWRLIFPWTPFNIKENLNSDGLIQSLNLPVKEIIFGNDVSSTEKTEIINRIDKIYKCNFYETRVNHKIERKPI